MREPTSPVTNKHYTNVLQNYLAHPLIHLGYHPLRVLQLHRPVDSICESYTVGLA